MGGYLNFLDFPPNLTDPLGRAEDEDRTIELGWAIEKKEERLLKLGWVSDLDTCFDLVVGWASERPAPTLQRRSTRIMTHELMLQLAIHAVLSVASWGIFKLTT